MDLDSNSKGSTAVPDLIKKIQRGDEQQIGIRLAPVSSGLYKTLGPPLSMPGWSIGSDGVRDWFWNGSQTSEGWLYLSFSPQELPQDQQLFPLEALFSFSPRGAIDLLALFLPRIEELCRTKSIDLETSLLQGIFFDETHTLYILNPHIAEIMDRDRQSAYTPAGISKEEEVSYYLLRGLYHLLWKKGETSEREYESPGGEIDTHPHLFLPSLNGKIADLLYRSLVLEEPLSVKGLSIQLQDWKEIEIFENLNHSEQEERESRAQKAGRKVQNRLQRQRFQRRYLPTILLSAAAAAVLAFFISPFIQRALEPSITEGLAPKEVIRLFYESLNSLDHETMGECIINGAGKAEINQVTTLFVIQRVRQGVERKEVFTSAPDWLEAGKPPLSEGAYVFGITDLEVQATEIEHIYRASYLKWSTLPPEASQVTSEESQSQIRSTSQVQAARVEEEVILKETREGWKISSKKLLSEAAYDFKNGD